MKNIKIIGRYFFALSFIYFGINHLIKGSNMAAYVPSWIPGGTFWIYLTGLGMLAASASFLSNKFTLPAGISLAVMMLIFVLTIHLPGVLNPETFQMSIVGFFKDICIAGGALMIAGDNSSREK